MASIHHEILRKDVLHIETEPWSCRGNIYVLVKYYFLVELSWSHGIRSRSVSSTIWWRPQDMYICIMSTNWGPVTHICDSKLGNGLVPNRRQPLCKKDQGNELQWSFYTNPLKQEHLNVTSAKCRSFCSGFNVLKRYDTLVCVRVTDII